MCKNHTIKNAPKINKTHLIEFSAQTITTSQCGISIKWNKTYTATGFGSYITIDQKGTVDYPSWLLATGTKGGNEVAARVIDGKYQIVNNTINPEISSGIYNGKLINDTPTISPTLNKSVQFVGNEARWDSPAIVKLM